MGLDEVDISITLTKKDLSKISSQFGWNNKLQHMTAHRLDDVVYFMHHLKQPKFLILFKEPYQKN